MKLGSKVHAIALHSMTFYMDRKSSMQNNPIKTISQHEKDQFANNGLCWSIDDWANVRSRISACQQRTEQAVQQLDTAHKALRKCNERLSKAKVSLHEVNARMPSYPSRAAYQAGSCAASEEVAPIHWPSAEYFRKQ